ncbi:MAG TPA: NAD(P)H-quinone oxidoreductase [Devosia sp.]|nr:NAD(P)H-quinone oxidoreductase [Devosia sp.]
MANVGDEAVMRAVEIERPGGPEVLRMIDMPRPQAGTGEIVIRVVAAGVNRPDIQQRRGLYPAPPGASLLPGLDVAGIIEDVGPQVDGLTPGDIVCALANGGGYAQYCCVPALHCMPVPRGFSFAEAAALPEVFSTAWNNLIWLGRLAQGETLLIQGGTSGVGMAGIQIARELRDAKVFATAGTEEKRQVCLDIGAQAAIDYRGDWPDDVRRLTGGEGVDVVLDAQAGPYTQKQLDLLKPDGRLVFIASHLGETAEVNIRSIVRRRLTLTGSTLRPRPATYKGRLGAELVGKVWPLLENGRIISRVHSVFPWEEVQDAHRLLDRNEQIGKVVLAIDPDLWDTVPNAKAGSGGGPC